MEMQCMHITSEFYPRIWNSYL